MRLEEPVTGRVVKGPAEALEWSLTPGCPLTKKSAKTGFAEATGIIHHVQWLDRHALSIVVFYYLLTFDEEGKPSGYDCYFPPLFACVATSVATYS